MDVDKTSTKLNEELKWLILNYYEPLIFKNFISTNLLHWNLEDWKNALKDEVLEFRRGKFIYTKNPQWQRLTPLEKGSFRDFLKEIAKPGQSEWLYFDYKYLKEWFQSVNDLRNNISWASLGFPEVTVDECTIWIGSKGAHTSCHQDTYGCNLVLQIYGRKLWLLFPPEENLKPTRIPYEESSIYSKLNFFSPTLEDFKGITNTRKVILNPGEVLLVPHRWWHYVENLETSISINVWLPLPQDNFERLNESVVQLMIKQISKELSTEENKFVMNPNMDEELANIDLKQMISVVKVCKDSCSTDQKKPKTGEPKQTSSLKRSEIYDCEKIISEYGCHKVSRESMEDFVSFLNHQRKRFGNTENQEKQRDNFISMDLFGLINILTDPEVVSLVTSKILQNKDM